MFFEFLTLFACTVISIYLKKKKIYCFTVKIHTKMFKNRELQFWGEIKKRWCWRNRNKRVSFISRNRSVLSLEKLLSLQIWPASQVLSQLSCYSKVHVTIAFSICLSFSSPTPPPPDLSFPSFFCLSPQLRTFAWFHWRTYCYLEEPKWQWLQSDVLRVFSNKFILSLYICEFGYMEIFRAISFKLRPTFFFF